MAVTLNALTSMTQTQLDNPVRRGPLGHIPQGDASATLSAAPPSEHEGPVPWTRIWLVVQGLGELAVRDLPEAWNSGMEQRLGIRPANDVDGCLQDIHWSMGGLGYFPTYTLGNLYGAQIYAALRRVFPDFDERFEAFLAEHPDQLRLLQNDPELLPNAVDEMIRWTAPVRHFMRTAQVDTEVAGVHIAKGDWLMLCYPSGNRDETVIEDGLRTVKKVLAENYVRPDEAGVPLDGHPIPARSKHDGQPRSAPQIGKLPGSYPPHAADARPAFSPASDGLDRTLLARRRQSLRFSHYRCR